MNISKNLIFSIFLFVNTLVIGALEKGPELIAQSAILYDFSTGRVLFEKEADLVIAPASMTKLITLYLGWESIESGRTDRDELVEIGVEGSSFSRPSGSSLMLLEEGQNVTFIEIMKGLAVSSGNDATYALAYHLCGSEEVFVDKMNRLVRSMGYKDMFFEDPDGWSSSNTVTASEYARFSADYIRRFPYALKEIHSDLYFTYPKPENLPENGGRIITARKKRNTNILLGKVEGVDGLKTGYIDESGFNFTATAQRGNTRFIAVVLGIEGLPYFEGIVKRAEEAETLLEYGFRNFKTIKPSVPEFDSITVWEGKEDLLHVQLSGTPCFTLSLEEMPSLKTSISIPAELDAPVSKGDVIGSLVYQIDGRELEVFQILASENIKKGNIFKVLWHKIKKLFRNVF